MAVSHAFMKSQMFFQSLGWGACLFLMIGCASVPPTHYYTFQPQIGSSTSPAAPTYPVTLGVEAYEAETPYQQERIVFRTSPYEVNFYEYHRWLRPPTDLVTEQAQKLLQSSGLFQRVRPYTYESEPDYVIRGRILLFDQWYNGTSSSIQVGIQYQLLDVVPEQVIWSDVIETTVSVPTLDIVDTVKGFETAVHQNIEQAIAAMKKVLASTD
jgi:ABC-type uncharacterized transport system auxiliary subunit